MAKATGTPEARLAAGLRSRGVIPGRNPDGINDDPEKALLLIDEWRSLAERRQHRIAELDGALRQIAAYEPQGTATDANWVAVEVMATIAADALGEKRG